MYLSYSHKGDFTLKLVGAHLQHPSQSLHFQDPARDDCNTDSSWLLSVLPEKDQVRKKIEKRKE